MRGPDAAVLPPRETPDRLKLDLGVLVDRARRTDVPLLPERPNEPRATDELCASRTQRFPPVPLAALPSCRSSLVPVLRSASSYACRRLFCSPPPLPAGRSARLSAAVEIGSAPLLECIQRIAGPLPIGEKAGLRPCGRTLTYAAALPATDSLSSSSLRKIALRPSSFSATLRDIPYRQRGFPNPNDTRAPLLRMRRQFRCPSAR